MKHVHAELMALYAQDAMETDRPWEQWEFYSARSDKWLSCEEGIGFYPNIKYRRKPRTIKVNGFDVPEPVRDSLKVEDSYWVAEPTCERYTSQNRWVNDPMDKLWFSRGIIHSTKEAAAKHAMAMCGIDPATYKEEE